MNSKLSAVAALGLAVFLSGCQTLDPYTREEETSNATKEVLSLGQPPGLPSG